MQKKNHVWLALILIAIIRVYLAAENSYANLSEIFLDSDKIFLNKTGL